MSTLWSWMRNQWDRTIALAAGVAGVILLSAGWIGASGTVYPAQQIPYVLSGGLFGIFCLAVGCTAWLSADLRDEWRKLDQLDATLRSHGVADDLDLDSGAEDVQTDVVESVRIRSVSGAGA